MIIDIPYIGEINLYSEIAGLLACLVICIGYIGKTNKTFYLTQTIANVLIATGYLLKGCLVPGIGVAICTLRSLTFLLFENKGKTVPKYIVGLFIVLVFINSICTWSTWYDIFALFTLTCYTLFYTIKDTKTLKMCMIIPIVSNIAYDIFTFYITDILLNIFQLIAILIYLIKFRIQSRTPKQDIETETTN